MSTIILYSTDDFYVIRTAKGFEVYRNGIVSSTRCAVIGYKGDKGLRRAIQECDRRQAEAKP